MVRLPDNRTEDTEKNGVPSLTALSQEVKELVRLISSTDISELHIESGPVRITIKRGGQMPGSHHAGTPHSHPVSTTDTPRPEAPGIISLIGNNPVHGGDLMLNEGEEVLVAPMVGTFYASPAPNEQPYVALDDDIEPGQIVGIIEAMKMMNEIEAETTGRITRILVENSQPVEYGQPLMVIQTM